MANNKTPFSISNFLGNGRLRRLTVISPTPSFYAYLTHKESNPGLHHTIIFNHEVTDSQHVYNHHTGIFTAPTSGVYAFQYSVQPDTGSNIPVEIMKNNQIMSAGVTRIHGGYYHNAASTVVFYMNSGDSCFVRTSTTNAPSGSIHSGHDARTSFAGWMIQ